MGIKDMFKNKMMEVINKKGLHNLLSEQLPPKKGEESSTNVVKPPIKVVQPKKTTQTTTPTQTTQTTTDKKVDPQIKELQNYLSVIRFYSPNGSRINIGLTNKLYNDVLNYFEGWKTSEPNMTLLQALILFLIESEEYNVTSFDAPQGFQSQVDLLIQENIITSTSGLKNILMEQAKRISYVVKGGKIQKPSQTTDDVPSTAGQPTGPLIEPKKPTPPVPIKPEPVKPEPVKPEGGEKNTKSEFANNINVKNILTYSNTIDLTGEPDKETCVDLIDIYSKNIPVISQAIKVGNMLPVGANDPTLIGIKKAVEWCIAKHRFTFRTKISDMNRINNLEEPFKIDKNILNK